MTTIGPVTAEIIDACTTYLKKENVKEDIMTNIADPIFNEIKKRYLSYFFLYFITNIIIIILLLFIIMKMNKKYNN